MILLTLLLSLLQFQYLAEAAPNSRPPKSEQTCLTSLTNLKEKVDIDLAWKTLRQSSSSDSSLERKPILINQTDLNAWGDLCVSTSAANSLSYLYFSQHQEPFDKDRRWWETISQNNYPRSGGAYPPLNYETLVELSSIFFPKKRVSVSGKIVYVNGVLVPEGAEKVKQIEPSDLYLLNREAKTVTLLIKTQEGKFASQQHSVTLKHFDGKHLVLVDPMKSETDLIFTFNEHYFGKHPFFEPHPAAEGHDYPYGVIISAVYSVKLAD